MTKKQIWKTSFLAANKQNRKKKDIIQQLITQTYKNTKKMRQKKKHKCNK